MPFYLEEIDVIPELAQFKSVLIVPCRFCPAASSALSRNEPYLEFLSRFLKTGSYEQFTKNLKLNLANQGVKTDIMKSNLLHQFVLCSWTSKKRNKLAKRARQYEALLVLGCEAAVHTIQDAVQSTSCQVIQGMKTMGLMSIKPKFHLPCNISLELDSITPIQEGKNILATKEKANIIPAACFPEQTGDCLQQRVT
jgi:hypothetical protein